MKIGRGEEGGREEGGRGEEGGGEEGGGEKRRSRGGRGKREEQETTLVSPKFSLHITQA